ncbi:hypothetical protein A1O1_07666 [Capronia coronata CBS 617.96]|uniref:CHCH domain-containing protein n=1 Tax=Capronia coronata CBS 617.96 TaxID=1182541 RepID=W9XM38_9EURO|nr:uncharacterized protein A1O1_07666 [Capronia coronata CBS 617.96]EXJ81602.1 hypothetical protein A1O1_07666 [Capronia coronata CBS 617.96]
MPRQRGPARSAPSRPTAPAPAPRSVAPQQQHRPMSTAAAPVQQHAAHPPPAQAQASQGPGLFGQMASTAAGVAVGSSIGHAIGGFFGGGSSSAPVEQQQQQQLPTDAYSQTGQAMDNALYTQSSSTEASGPCAADIKSFTDCMNQNQGNLSICGWYMEQLKACQQAARQY